MRRISRATSACLILLACEPASSGGESNEPEPALASPEAATTPAEAETTPAEVESAAPEVDAASAEDGREAERGVPSAPEAEPGTDEGGDTAKTTPQPEAKASLPKPLHGEVREGCGRGAGVGQRVKSFKLQTPEGKTVSPAYYRGRVMLLNFWGSWCKPCLEELPEFSRLYRRYRKHGMTLLAVATDEDADAVKRLLEEKKISAKVGLGGEAVAGAYGDRNFPFTFVVDHQGVIRAAYDGYKEECLGALERDLREALEARPK